MKNVSFAPLFYSFEKSKKKTDPCGRHNETAGYAFGRYARLPLTSKLDALCAAYVNRHSFAQMRTEPSSNPKPSPTKNKRTPTGSVLLFLEVTAGFEPADNGVADRGLTTWLRHQIFVCLNIIAELFRFVKCFFTLFSAFWLFLSLLTNLLL